MMRRRAGLAAVVLAAALLPGAAGAQSTLDSESAEPAAETPEDGLPGGVVVLDGEMSFGAGTTGASGGLGFTGYSSGRIGSLEVSAVDGEVFDDGSDVYALAQIQGAVDIGPAVGTADAIVLTVAASVDLSDGFWLVVGDHLLSSDGATVPVGELNSTGGLRFWLWDTPCKDWALGGTAQVRIITFGDDPAERWQDASLHSLALDGAQLGSEFDPATLSYAATAPANAQQVSVSAAAPFACSVDISPADVDPVAEGHQVEIDDQGVQVSLTVTAPDGSSTQQYTVQIADETQTRSQAKVGSLFIDAASDLGFVPTQTRHKATVPPGTTSTQIDAVPEEGTETDVWSITAGDTHATRVGTDSTVELTPGADTVVAVRASTEHYESQRIYTVRLTTPSGSAAESPPTSNPPQQQSQPRGRTEISFLASSSADDVADRPSPSSSARDFSGATRASGGDWYQDELVGDWHSSGYRFSSNSGRNNGGSTATDPQLTGLSVDPGTLDPVFAAGTYQYDVSVGHGVAQITVSPTAGAGASTTITPVDADTTTAGHQVALNAPVAGTPAQTAVLITVTEGAEMEAYTVTVTRQAPPAPGAPTVHNIYTQKVTLHWTAPELETGDAPITAYDVQYKVVDATDWTDGPQDVAEDPGDPGLRAEITGLVPDINYLFRVQAQSGEAESAWSDTTEATTAFWESRLRTTAVDNSLYNILLGFDTSRGIGWLSNGTITYNDVDYEISTLGQYRSYPGHERSAGGVKHTQSLDFHVYDLEIPGDWVLTVGDRKFKLSDASHRTLRGNARPGTRPVYLTFWLDPQPGLTFERDFERDLSMSRDPAQSSRGVALIPEEEPETEPEETEESSDSDTTRTLIGAQVAHDQVTITWAAPEEGTVVGYRIWRGPDAENLAVLDSNTGTTATTYVDTDVEEGTTYVYAIEPILAGSTSTDDVSNALGQNQGNSQGSRSSGFGQRHSHSYGSMSPLATVRTLVEEPDSWGPRADLNLISLPVDSEGTQILPVSDFGDGFRHTWANEPLQQFVQYSVDLEPNTVYSVLLWDPDHAEQHVQFRGDAARTIIFDFRGDVSRERLVEGTRIENLPHEERLLGDDYHFWLTGIKVGPKNGRDLFRPPADSRTGDLSGLHFIELGSPLRGYTFQTGATGGRHHLELRMITTVVHNGQIYAGPPVVHQIRIEKHPDHPNQPSQATQIHQSNTQRYRYGWYEGFAWGGIGSGDQDWFHVRLFENKRYEFALETSGEWRNLRHGDIVGLAGPDGTLIPSTASATRRLTYKTPHGGGGDYYIGVRSSSSTGTGMYQLWVRDVDVPSGTSTDITLGIGKEYLSFFHSKQDRDTYKIEVKADRKYRVEIYPWTKTDTHRGIGLTHAYALRVGNICERTGCTDVLDAVPERSYVKYHENRAEFSPKRNTTLYFTVRNDASGGIAATGVKVGAYFVRVLDIGAAS